MSLIALNLYLLFPCAAASYFNTGMYFLHLLPTFVTIYPGTCQAKNLQVILRYQVFTHSNREKEKEKGFAKVSVDGSEFFLFFYLVSLQIAESLGDSCLHVAALVL